MDGQLLEQPVSRIDILSEQFTRRSDGERQAGKLRSQAVVQVTAQAPPLLFTRRHQPLA